MDQSQLSDLLRNKFQDMEGFRPGAGHGILSPGFQETSFDRRVTYADEYICSISYRNRDTEQNERDERWTRAAPQIDGHPVSCWKRSQIVTVTFRNNHKANWKLTTFRLCDGGDVLHIRNGLSQKLATFAPSYKNRPLV